MKRWLKIKLRAFLGYDDEIKKAYRLANSAHAKAVEAERIIRERTDVHVDISPRGRDPHVVIMVGRYNGRDFVQTYSIREVEFKAMMRHLMELKKYGEIRRVDAPMDMMAYIDKELMDW